jgi:glycosyltransferase involved in cell wall biosynthesis
MAVIPLRKISLFEGAIPSKIFEILYLEKPILLGVAGEAKKIFIDDAGAGIAFDPQNGAELARHILFFADHPDLMNKMGQQGKKYVLEHFNRVNISQNFWSFIQY